MPSYTVSITRTTTEIATLSIDAEDDDAAAAQAEEITSQMEHDTYKGRQPDWDLDDTQFEVNSVDED